LDLARRRPRRPSVRVRSHTAARRRPAPRNRRRRNGRRRCSCACVGRRLLRGHDARQRSDTQHPDAGRLHRVAHAPRLVHGAAACERGGGKGRRPRGIDGTSRGGRAVCPSRHPLDERRRRLSRPRVPAPSEAGGAAPRAAGPSGSPHGRGGGGASPTLGGRSDDPAGRGAACGGADGSGRTGRILGSCPVVGLSGRPDGERRRARYGDGARRQPPRRHGLSRGRIRRRARAVGASCRSADTAAVNASDASFVTTHRVLGATRETRAAEGRSHRRTTAAVAPGSLGPAGASSAPASRLSSAATRRGRCNPRGLRRARDSLAPGTYH